MNDFDFSVIRNLRAKHKMSAEELAKRAGLTRMTVVRLEQNAGNPTMETIRAAACVFGMEASELIRLAENPRVERARAAEYCIEGVKGTQMAFQDFELFDLHAQAGVHTVFDPMLHTDAYEVCAALTGELKLNVGGEAVLLKKGEAVRFRAMHEHTLEVMKASHFLMLHHRMD